MFLLLCMLCKIERKELICANSNKKKGKTNILNLKSKNIFLFKYLHFLLNELLHYYIYFVYADDE